MENIDPSATGYCPYCYPEKVDHKQTKINSFLMAYINKPLSILFQYLFCNRPIYFSDRFLIGLIILLRRWGKVQLQRGAKLEQMVTRLRLLWHEAKNKELSIHSFSLNNRQLISFLLIYKGKNHYFHYSPTTLLHKYFKQFKDPTIYDDKAKFKKLLAKRKLPHPKGKVFFSKKKAFIYGIREGFPLVVKPASSSLSQHISLQINDEQMLKRAITIAKTIDVRIIVEKFIPGFVHRMMVVGDQFLVCSKRLPPSIVGDGESTINELINSYNDHPLRGEVGELGYALYKVTKNSQLLYYLACQDLSLDSLLEKGQRIYLTEKSNCSNGAEVINLTEQVCQENIELFKKVHSLLGIAVSAIDFICSDITKPWHLQPFAFLENNSFPAIDSQHYPSSGKPVDVAKAIWEYVLKHLDKL